MAIGLVTNRAWPLIVLAIGVVVAAWFLPSLLQALLVIFAGILIGNFLARLATNLAHIGHLPFGVAYGAVILAILLLLGGTAYYMGNQIAEQISTFIEKFEQARTEIGSRLELQGWWQRLNRIRAEGQAGWTANQAISTATTFATTALTVIGGVVLVAFLGFYFGLQADRYRAGFVALFRPQARDRVRHILDISSTRLWHWTLGRLVGMAVIGVSSAVGLWMLGIPLPITLGVLAGVLNFVPNIGPIIAGIPAVLFGLQQGTNVAMYVLLFYVVLQFAESYFLTPLIDQHQVSIPPGLMLSSQLLLGVMAGFLALFLATPLTILAVILIKELHVKPMDRTAAESLAG